MVVEASSPCHLELLVEDLSLEVFLRGLLERFLPTASFQVHSFQGKQDLLRKLPVRLKGYASWLPEDWRILVVVDRDEEDCRGLKQRLEECARAAGLRTRAQAAATGSPSWCLVNRIAIEELEAWFFGEWEAVCTAYPGVPKTIPRRKGYRVPDGIPRTWEALERILQRHRYFRGGLRKLELAEAMGEVFEPNRCQSHSFQVFWRTVLEACS